MERKLTAILSADVAGYSRLMGEAEEATLRTLTAYREEMTTIIHQHRGRIVGTAGDSVLAEFASVVDTVQCAVVIQATLKAENASLPPSRRMAFRIGINLGDVMVDGQQIYGDGVNIAARLESLAEPGGICISGTVYEHIKNKLSLGYEDLGAQAVKNIAEPVRVWRVQISPEADVSTGSTSVLGQAQHERPPTPVILSVSKPVLSEVEGGNQPKRRLVTARLAWVVMVGLVLIVVAIVTVRYLSRPLLSPQSSAPITQEAPALPLPDKPSIVVLPFVNMSEDPEQEYFSDGITEDLTSALSRLSGLFVISRNTAFFYKGKTVKMPELSKERGGQAALVDVVLGS